MLILHRNLAMVLYFIKYVQLLLHRVGQTMAWFSVQYPSSACLPENPHLQHCKDVVPTFAQLLFDAVVP